MPAVIALLLKDIAIWFLRIFVVSFITKIIISFGFAIVTYKGLDYIFEILKTHFLNAYYTMPAVFLQLLEIGGFREGLNIMFSAISFLIAFYSSEQFFKMMK